jgi:uncharacterized protein (TIGR00725 family)
MSSPTATIPIIAVVGGAECDENAATVAREVGAEIARRGWHLLCGGGGGVMEAACRGFREAREEMGSSAGVAIALLPGADAGTANPFVDVALATGVGLARNALIARAAAALVAVDGCAGTLSEIAYGWQMGKPIVALAGTGGWAAELAGRRLDPRRADPVFAASTAAEAIEHLAARVEAGT